MVFCFCVVVLYCILKRTRILASVGLGGGVVSTHGRPTTAVW